MYQNLLNLILTVTMWRQKQPLMLNKPVPPCGPFGYIRELVSHGWVQENCRASCHTRPRLISQITDRKVWKQTCSMEWSKRCCGQEWTWRNLASAYKTSSWFNMSGRSVNRFHTYSRALLWVFNTNTTVVKQHDTDRSLRTDTNVILLLCSTPLLEPLG